MSYIQLNPEPSIYSTNVDVTGVLSPDVKEIIYTSDGTAPTLAKYIAYDTLTPPNPFIAAVQDGRGNVLFDGGFPKWYNTYYNTAMTTFVSLPAAGKYLANAMDFIANVEKVANGNRKILVMGDANVGASYNIKETGTNDFKTTLDVVANIMNYELVFKTTSDYGTMLDPSYSELNEYCGCIFFSTVHTSSKLITDAAISNFSAFREAGNGIFLITDHGTGSTGFYRTANYIMSQYGAYFTGDFNRSPVNVGFLRATYGDHPLYKNLDDSEYIHAGGSESKVVVTERTSYTNIPSITISNVGYTTLRYLVVLNDGSVVSESFTYGISVPPLLEPLDENGEILDETFIEPTVINTYDLNVSFDYSTFSTFSGLVKNGDVVKGTFESTSTNGTSYTWLDGATELKVTEGPMIQIEVQSPIKYFKNIDTKVVIPKQNSMSYAKLVQNLNVGEFSDKPQRILNRAESVLNITKTKSLVRKLNSIFGFYK